MIVATKEQMNAIDRRMAEEYGLPGLLLMEHAAMAVAKAAASMASAPGRCLVLAGPGSNGGDGFAAARILIRQGWQVDVALCGGKPPAGDAAVMAAGLERYAEEGRTVLFEGIGAGIEPGRYDLCIDGLFGTGCTRPLEGGMLEAVRWVNGSGLPVLAIDLPSGVAANDGRICGEAVRASATVVLGLPKPGNLIGPGAELGGRLIFADIGLDPVCAASAGHAMETLEPDILAKLPPRKNRSHKYTYGRVLLAAGSEAMPGAAVMASLAACRAGTGLVMAAIEKSASQVLFSQVPEAVGALYEKEGGMEAVSSAMDRADAILVGPGCGVDAATERLLEMALSQDRVPVVVDADGLTVLAGRLDLLESRKAQVILTPHHGEMARLAHTGTAAVSADPAGIARDFSRRYKAITVLKSHRTLVARPDGFIHINTTGSHSLATAGSGDVLAGMMASLLGQGCSAADAALLSVYCHGRCGELAAEKAGGRGVLAREIAELIPAAMEVAQ